MGYRDPLPPGHVTIAKVVSNARTNGGARLEIFVRHDGTVRVWSEGFGDFVILKSGDELAFDAGVDPRMASDELFTATTYVIRKSDR